MLKGSRSKARGAVAEHLARPYSRILIPQEDGRFSAEVLEFPGCFAEGADSKAAYANLEAAAESWLLACLANGTPIPPPLTNYEVSGRFALRLPRSLYLRASKSAAREGVSLNQFVTTAVAEKLGALDVTRKLDAALSEFRNLARQFVGGLITQVSYNAPVVSRRTLSGMNITAETGTQAAAADLGN
ncbi:MAG TPA: toxin-antitoxin system HicB family antitoxin [Vicinamibacteria bacterium]|nr:toxin-antitoxin system HicB family antitoxin [Vicinamibacteria bacterium]